MDYQQQTFSMSNPVFFAPVRNDDVGYIAVLTVMSRRNYGLLVCMCDSDVEQTDLELIGSMVARPLVSRISSFIKSYQVHLGALVERLAPVQSIESYYLKVLAGAEVQLHLPDGYLPKEKEDEIWYVYIAPVDVPFEEFLEPIPKHLN